MSNSSAMNCMALTRLRKEADHLITMHYAAVTPICDHAGAPTVM